MHYLQRKDNQQNEEFKVLFRLHGSYKKSPANSTKQTLVHKKRIQEVQDNFKNYNKKEMKW